jgi:hypothetical protein
VAVVYTVALQRNSRKERHMLTGLLGLPDLIPDDTPALDVGLGLDVNAAGVDVLGLGLGLEVLDLGDLL